MIRGHQIKVHCNESQLSKMLTFKLMQLLQWYRMTIDLFYRHVRSFVKWCKKSSAFFLTKATKARIQFPKNPNCQFPSSVENHHAIMQFVNDVNIFASFSFYTSHHLVWGDFKKWQLKFRSRPDLKIISRYLSSLLLFQRDNQGWLESWNSSSPFSSSWPWVSGQSWRSWRTRFASSDASDQLTNRRYI